jgi:sugar lactone lactonase YvrE
VPHGNVVTLASDPVRNVIYGAAVPTGEIYRYDVGHGRTDVLGRPSSYDQPYVYTGRVMWVDTRGRLYFTAGGSTNLSVSGHVHYYDPETGFGERKDWPLQDGKALEVGQCLAKEKQCFFSDDHGHVYRFDEHEPSWSYLGQIETGEQGLPTFIWLFDVSSDGTKAYAGTSTSPEPSDFTSLYEFDLKSGQTRRLCSFAELDPAFRELHIHTGYDAWDPEGRFYFASFNGHQPVVLARIDPARLKEALSKR